MARSVVILHGYSDTKKSFRPLHDFLRDNGFQVAPIYLGDYVTLEDQITIEDLAKAFETALVANGIPTTARAFDLVVHSTGALVAREWMTRFYLEQNKSCPVAHFLMLAPANFGSPLAHLGRTMFGRVINGWRSKFEVGDRLLHALEMASPYTWHLAQRDLFGPQSFYAPDNCMAAVLMGTKPYQSGFRRLVDHNGADGTVYVCTANLNATGLTVRFGRADERPAMEPWARTAEPIAFGVFPDRDHSSIVRPATRPADLGQYILRFLKLGSARTYETFRRDCDSLTQTTLPDQPPAEIFHTYQNAVAHVRDDLGMDVPDFFLEFYSPETTRASRFRFDSLMQKIHNEVLEHVHAYRANNSYRSFLFDLTDLRQTLAGGKPLRFSLSAAPVSTLIGYSAGAANDVGELPVDAANDLFWRPNESLLLDLVIQRTQQDKMFQLKQL